jgi:hypothetical protein
MNGIAQPWRSRSHYIGRGRLLICLDEPDLMVVVDGEDHRNVGPLIRDGRLLPSLTAFLERTVQEEWRCVDVGSLWGYVGCLLGRLAWRGSVQGFDAGRAELDLRAAGVAANGLNWQVAPVLARTGAQAAVGSDGVPQVTLDATFGRDSDSRVDLLYVDARAHIRDTFAGAAKLLGRRPHSVVIGWEPNVARALGREPAEDAQMLATLGLMPARLLPDGSTKRCGWGDVIHGGDAQYALLHD